MWRKSCDENRINAFYKTARLMCRVHRLRISDSAMQRELWIRAFAFLKPADEVYEEQLKFWNRLVTNNGFSVVRNPMIRIPGRSEEIWFKRGPVISIQVRITSHYYYYYYYCCCYYYCILLCVVFPLEGRNNNFWYITCNTDFPHPVCSGWLESFFDISVRDVTVYPI